MTAISIALMMAAGVLVTLILLPVAASVGLVDHPDERKVHSGRIPLVGGIAIFATALVCAVFATAFDTETRLFFLASGIVLAAGIIDDRWGLTPRSRFIAQSAAVLVMILVAGLVLENFGNLFLDRLFSLGLLAIPITVFSALGVINAFNMVDGIDGLSGTIFIIAALAMIVLIAGADHPNAQNLLGIYVAATFGFLVLNARWPWLKSAKVYLGDSGSALLGFVLAWYFVDLSQGDQRIFAPITAVWLVAVPLLDTFFLIIKRVRERKSPFGADRHHLHHAFLRAGFSVRQTWLSIGLLAVLLAGFGVFSEWVGWPEYWRFYLFILLSSVYNYTMRRVWLRRRFLGRAMK